jgi:parvulin-like peptidyl-prolyl isomerase
MALLLAVTPLFAVAQEGEPVVVDEVIAQVNNDVVTLSMLRKASAEAVEAFKQGGADEKKASEEVSKRQAEIIISLIDENLLTQKAKELNIEEAIEGEVNREFLRLANEYKVKTLEELYELMRRSGVTPESVRRTLRLQLTRDFVLRQDLYSALYYAPSAAELQAYFEKNKDRFKRPETVELSEIFLELAGKVPDAVLQKANQLVAEARKPNADFGALAAANSERTGPDGRFIAAQTKGKVGKFVVPELQPEIAAAIKTVAAAGVSEPIKTPEGYVILRVDARVPGSDSTNFNEDQVRQAMLVEKADPERIKYLAALRKDAYIKIAEAYRPTVDPLLYKDAAPSAVTAAGKEDKKKKDKKKKN